VVGDGGLFRHASHLFTPARARYSFTRGVNRHRNGSYRTLVCQPGIHGRAHRPQPVARAPYA
jgi:hypothetical protein